MMRQVRAVSMPRVFSTMVRASHHLIDPLSVCSGSTGV